MSDMLDVSCPNCDKELKVPSEFAGKRVKCRGCEEVFTIKAAGKPKPPARKPDPKPEPKPEPKPPVAEDDDDDDGPAKSMGITKEDDVARCPHCVKELDPPDAVVCLHCGFNNQTRIKAGTQKVIAADASDWMLHLAPGIIALIIVIAIVALDAYCWVHMRGWLKDSILELDEKDLSDRKKMVVPPGAFIAFILVFSAMIVIPATRFVFRRLILGYKPEERVKK